MKNLKIIFVFALLMLSVIQAFSQILPPDPGSGGGASAPLDGGLLMGLLAGGGFLVSLIAGKKKKNK